MGGDLFGVLNQIRSSALSYRLLPDLNKIKTQLSQKFNGASNSGLIKGNSKRSSYKQIKKFSQMKFATCLAIASTVAAVKVSTELSAATAQYESKKDNLKIVRDKCEVDGEVSKRCLLELVSDAKREGRCGIQERDVRAARAGLKSFREWDYDTLFSDKPKSDAITQALKDLGYSGVRINDVELRQLAEFAENGFCAFVEE